MKWAKYYDEEMIRQTIETLKPNNELFEVRIIGKGGGRKRIISGYFTDCDTLIKQFDTIDPRGTNIYITINKVNEDCYAREQHDCFRVTDANTHDHEIDSYEWLFIDLDPKRVADVSSSDAELEAARKLSNDVLNYMGAFGFSDPVQAMSGNGYHLLYRIDLPNQPEMKRLIEECLLHLSELFDNDKVKIDVVNHNQSRICKLYGTMAQKGSSTKNRPHRMSKLLHVPKEIKVNDINMIKLLAAEYDGPTAESRASKSRKSAPVPHEDFEIESWMSSHGLDYIRKDIGTDCVIYPLRECPFDSSHTNGDSKIFRYSDGAIAFKCHHNSCRGKKWQDVRELLEPGAYDANENDAEIDAGWQQHKKATQYLVVSKTDDVEAVKKQLPKLSAISAFDLQNKEFAERYYAVADMIPQGETVIAAPPKTGKSWLMLDMCLKIAKGEKFLGFDTNRSDTLYLALEDGDSFEQERLNIIMEGEEAPKNFHFVFTNVMPMNEGFILQIDELLKQFPGIKVVVIDTLQFVKYRQGKSESAYECDYRTGRDLKEFAEKHDLAIVVVTHTTKMKHIEDDMANVSGTNGVTGAADAVIVLDKEKRMDKEATMFITGRKVRQSMHRIKFNDSNCCWEYLGVEDLGDRAQREREEKERQFSTSKIRDVVLMIAENTEGECWKGRAKDIIDEAIKYKIALLEGNKEIGGFLNRMQGLFLEVDGVQIEKVKNGTGPYIYKIYPKEKEEDIPF